MADNDVLHVSARRQQPGLDDRGRVVWQIEITPRRLPARQTALLLCDVWDHHWCRGAEERLADLLPRMNEVVQAVRARGVHIIHAPSETMAFYAGTPARERILAIPLVEPPPDREHADPPLPIDDSDGGCDSGEPPWHRAWTRQHPAIVIDQERDVIADEGPLIYSYLRHRQIEYLLVMGVHTNMCVLNRPFAIKQMVRWGVDVMLVRDLTDTMYNPMRPPYVSHEEGTRLVVEFIEKFWCPTIVSADLL